MYSYGDSYVLDPHEEIVAGTGLNEEHLMIYNVVTRTFCGQAITGETIRRRLRSGGVREHACYRCANNSPGSDHPIMRWRESDLEIAIVKDLHTLQFPDKETAGLFRESLVTSFSDLVSARKRQLSTLAKRKNEPVTMQDRLLNAYLANTIDEATYSAKSAELKSETLKAEDDGQ